jgi:hypothetical protein
MTSLLQTAAAGLALAMVAAPPRDLAGTIPEALSGAGYVVWIPASGSSDASCRLDTPGRWACSGILSSEAGVVTIAGEAAIAYVAVSEDGAVNPVAVASWGRMIRIVPGGVAEEALKGLQGLRLAPWKPARSNLRRQAQRFVPVEDSAVGVIRLSDVAFWVAGVLADPDAFVRIEGPEVATTRLFTAALAEGPPDVPVFVAMTPPTSLIGRVQSKHADDADEAEVELLEPLRPHSDRVNDRDSLFIRRGKTRTSADGTFRFEKVEPGIYQIAATHPTYGRGAARVDRLGEPIVIHLTDPGRVSGRVLQRGVPVPAARVRFVPDQTSWAASVDPGDYIVNDVYAGADGRFTLTLPARREGVIQVTAPDGAMMRLPSPSPDNMEASLGDIILPAPIQVRLRLLDGPADCALFAIGPLGRLGLSIVPAARSLDVYDLSLPEPGAWGLNAECGGRVREVDPPVISSTTETNVRAIDFRIERAFVKDLPSSHP